MEVLISFQEAAAKLAVSISTFGGEGPKITLHTAIGFTCYVL